MKIDIRHIIRHFELCLLFGLTMIALALNPATGFAKGEKTYTIANFEIWGEANDAVSAKNEALREGRRAAFEQLMKRFISFQDFKKIPKPNDKILANLVTSLKVRNERNSNTEYLATLDFNFSRSKVRKILTQTQLRYTDRRSPIVTLVPIVDESLLSNKALIEEDGIEMSTIWRESWQTLDLSNGLVPIKLAARKGSIDNTVLAALIAGESQAQSAVQQIYQSQAILIALLSPAEKQDEIRIHLIGQDRVGPLHYVRDHKVANGEIVIAADWSSEIAKGVIDNRWKILQLTKGVRARPSTPSLPWSKPRITGERLQISVLFSGLAEWQSIRSRLSNIEGVEDLAIEGLSARSAEISLSYPGGMAALQSAVGAQNMFLSQQGDKWQLQGG